MKVLQISAFSGWGCTGRILQGICEVLDEHGHEAAAAWGRINTAPATIRTIRIGNRYDQLFHGAYTRVTDRCGFGSGRVTGKFLEELEAYAPDLVHLHIMHGYYINLELLFTYLKEKKIPVVWTFHDCWAFTGHCPYFDVAGCGKWKEGCYRCEQKRHHPASFVLDRSEKNYQDKRRLFTGIEDMTIVTPSQWLAGLVKMSFLKEYPVFVIHNGIDVTSFHPEESDIKEKLGLQGRRLLLGVSSTWSESKGLKDFAALAGKLPPEYRIVLVGLSREQRNGIPAAITGLERTDSVKELAQLYTAADVFLNLTYEDNYPTTNLEAMACGTPVITYRTGGSVEIVEATGFGSIVAQGDLDGVIGQLRASHEWEGKRPDPALLDQRERFQEYLSLYERILDGRKGAAHA